MSRAARLARRYGVAVQFADFGSWGQNELRAEYDPTVPAIRINKRIVDQLPNTELERFVDIATAHELHHHREHIGEVPVLPDLDSRERAAAEFAEAVASGEVPMLFARTVNGVTLWNYADVDDVLQQFAKRGHVILGFDVLEVVGGGLRPWGSSAYELRPAPGEERAPYARRSLDLARRDLKRLPELTGLRPPFDDLWFDVTFDPSPSEAVE